MLLKINPENPEQRKIQQVVDTLNDGGIIIYPTDTVYGLGCDIFQPKAVERICRLRGLDPAKAMLSFICSDISEVSNFTLPISTPVFKVMRKNLPGPFTFVLNSNNQVPKLFKNKKRTIGIRIPDNAVSQAIVNTLGRPLLTLSLKSEDHIAEYYTDPEDFKDEFQKLVDIVIDSGPGRNVPSTVVDCTGEEPLLIREGAGALIL
jgi:tRNA threonylcarbamoyl adenosine modification protein (Sua5/YciO/YrdC/YwlC family)